MEKVLNTLRKTSSLVDASLLSESLSSVLLGLCDLVGQQQKDIDYFKKEIAHLVRKSELTDAVQTVESKINEFQDNFEISIADLQRKTDKLAEQCKTIENNMSDMQKNVSQGIKDVQAECKKQTDGDLFILREQIANDNASTAQRIKDDMEPVLKDLSIVKEWMHRGDSDTDEDPFRGHLNSMENMIKANAERIESLSEAIENSAKPLRKEIETIEKESKNEIRRLSKCVIELNERTTGIGEISGDVMNMTNNINDPASSAGAASSANVMRAIGRNGRRIDKVEQRISALHQETENIGATMKEYQRVLAEYHHNLCDLAGAMEDTKNKVLGKIDGIKELVSWTGAGFDMLWKSVTETQRGEATVLNVIAKTFDNVIMTISRVAAFTMPKLDDFDTIVVNQSKIHDVAGQRYTCMEIEKEVDKLKRLFSENMDIASLEPAAFEQARPFTPTLAPMEISAFTLEPSQPAPVPVTTAADPRVMGTIETMRTQMKAEHDAFRKAIQTMQKELQVVKPKLETKMDADSCQRVLDRLEARIGKLRGEMVALQTDVARAKMQEASYETPPQYYNDYTTKQVEPAPDPYDLKTKPPSKFPQTCLGKLKKPMTGPPSAGITPRYRRQSHTAMEVQPSKERQRYNLGSP